MLNSFQTTLYQSLQDFELDDPTHEFGFTRHLMKNQGWTLTYAQRAIAEYKKFAFLTVVANHQVVPSDQVDQVWHAHVLLTQSYWEVFCPQVLGKKLHHHPARGGRMERAEFHYLYAQTIASYRHFFGSPPTDIWSPPDLRFGAELKMQRVNFSDYWLIPKRLPQLSISKPIMATVMLAFVTVGCRNVGQKSILGTLLSDFGANPLAAILSVSIILGLVLRYLIRMPSKQPQKPQLDYYETAYLAGGSERAVELAITQLVHQGYLRPNVRKRTLAIEKAPLSKATPLEQQVIRQLHQTPELKNLRQPHRYQTDFLRERLEQEQLLMTGQAALIGSSFGFFFLITFFIIFLGSILAAVLPLNINLQIAAELWLGVGIISICCIVPGGRTRWGGWILADIQKNHDVYDLTQRFAIYGYRVLSGGALDDLKQIFANDEAEPSTGGCGCGC